MTIYYDKLEDQYWIASEDGPLFFDSPLGAKDALREMEIRQAIADEVELIVAWLRAGRRHGDYEWMGRLDIADAIENREYRRAA